MAWWQVTIRIRQCGGLGLFEPRVFRVRADELEQAKAWALEDAYAIGVETGIVTHVVQEPKIVERAAA